MDQSIKGTIEIHSDGTISIKLDNKDWCVHHYPIGIRNFLEITIEKEFGIKNY